MGLFVLIAALLETITDTIKGAARLTIEEAERRRYENIDFPNIESVTFDGVETAYRIETEEEFDPVRSYDLSQQDGWAHYETKTVEYEVEDGLNYLFTIRYKDGSEIYRKFHETSPLTKKLLEYCNKEYDLGNTPYLIDGENIIFENVGNTSGIEFETFDEDDEDDEDDGFEDFKNEKFAVIDFETTGLNYNPKRQPMDEILSVAIIDQDGNELLNTYCDTVKIKTWYDAQRIHGISPRDVRGYPTFADILPKVIEILSSYDYVISYNISFEKSFLEGYARVYTPTDHSVYSINWGGDPMEMFMDYMGSNKFLKLSTAAEHFGYRYQAHNALEDAKAALHVYNALMDEE